MRTIRDVAIIMLLAFVVAFAPANGNLAEAILAAITLGFLAALAWTAFVFSRRNQLTLMTLSDRRRGALYGALGLIVLLFAGADEIFSTGIGTVVWILLLGGSIATIWRIWTDARAF